jgi:putative thioredoxin
MLFSNKKPAAANGSKAADDMIFDVGTQDFEDKVMRASIATPILVDFWAPWCGPCKQLMPVLEAEVRAAGGKVKLAKINIDEHPELAQALRVQSVPTVFAFVGGQPVTAFAGARPASEIKALIAQLMEAANGSGGAEEEAAIDIPATLTAAAQALADGQPGPAQEMYALILSQDENNAAAFAGLVRTFIAMGELEQARYVIDDAPDAVKADPQIAAARVALELAEKAPPAGALEKMAAVVQAAPDDLQARFDYGVALFAAGRRMDAIDEMVTIIGKNRTWEEDKARLQLLQFFDAMGPADPDTMTGRRKLSTVLFS